LIKASTNTTASATPAPRRRFSVAPMMDWTDRHCRFFLRLFSRHTVLYTEMISTGALIHGDARKHLRFDASEHPVAIQLGGSDPREMALCARMAEDAGYDEVNMNVGCPSDRVQSGRFGACLMADPQLVAENVAAMRDAVKIDVSVKTRIGIDRDESTDRMYAVVDAVRATGCRDFIIHARKAWLDGLSPKENREIPPLRYEVVYALKRRYPELDVSINGGITRLDQIARHLGHVDGVMVGREAYHNPYLLASIDSAVYGDDHRLPQRREIVEALVPYIEREMAEGHSLHSMTRHVMGLYQGMPGVRAWRRVLSEKVHRPGAGIATLMEALAHVEQTGDRAEPDVAMAADED
jgi:tRNA-dihydrouridine synthase A